METTLPPERVSFFLKLLLRYLFKTRVSYDKAFKTIVNKYQFPKWMINSLYKLGFNVVNYYYSLRWLASRKGYGSRPSSVVNYLSSIGFSIKKALAELKDLAKDLAISKKLSILYSYPEFLVEDLLNHLDLNELEKMLSSLNTRKRWLRINTLKTSVEDALECLEKTGITYEREEYPEYMVYVKNPLWEPIGHNKCVLKGYVIPQDISSSLVVEASKPITGSILDACSAPGLKLSLLFMLSDSIRQVFAVDKSRKRINAEYKLLNRLSIPFNKVVLIRGDSATMSYNRVFDLAIIDAPCSGLGAVYSDPAVKLNTPIRRKLKYYHSIQYKILVNTLRYAERVVYATCSIHPLEGEAVIEKVVNMDYADTLQVNNPVLSSAYPGYTVSSKTYRVKPHIVNGQGFFIAILESRIIGKTHE
ncbi:MAG: RsmB/NOP family class I SAM-dependent RNA methyltransferase [Thermoprotei archaeon]